LFMLDICRISKEVAAEGNLIYSLCHGVLVV